MCHCAWPIGLPEVTWRASLGCAHAKPEVGVSSLLVFSPEMTLPVGLKKKYGKKVRGKDSLTGRNPTSGCAPKGTWPSVNSDSPIGHAQWYYCTTTIGRKERGNRLRIRRAYFRTRDWRHFRWGMVTLLPVALSVMRNGTFCTTTVSGHVTSGDVTSGCACARDHFW